MMTRREVLGGLFVCASGSSLSSVSSANGDMIRQVYFTLQERLQWAPQKQASLSQGGRFIITHVGTIDHTHFLEIRVGNYLNPLEGIRMYRDVGLDGLKFGTGDRYSDPSTATESTVPKILEAKLNSEYLSYVGMVWNSLSEPSAPPLAIPGEKSA